jgi:hypothetical protein
MALSTALFAAASNNCSGSFHAVILSSGLLAAVWHLYPWLRSLARACYYAFCSCRDNRLKKSDEHFIDKDPPEVFDPCLLMVLVALAQPLLLVLVSSIGSSFSWSPGRCPSSRLRP